MKKTGYLFLILFVSGFSCGHSYAEETLTWQDCIKEAARNHPDLISAEENIKQFDAAKKISASGLYPQINSNLGASTAKTAGKKSDTYTYGVSAAQLVFDGFKTTNNVKSAAEDIKASRYNYRFTSSQVRFRLRNAFINLLKAQESLNLAQDIYNIRRSNLELITLRYQSGIEHRGALLTAEANLEQAKFEIEQDKRALEVAQRQLTKEMGRTKFSLLKAEGDFEVKDTAAEKPDFEALAEKNPSLGKLDAQKKSASFGINAAKANFLPELSAQAGADKNSSHWPPRDDQWNMGLTLSFPIFEGGLRLAQVDKAKALFNQAEENERSGRDGVILALSQNWAAFQDAVETVNVQRKFVEAAQERSRIAEAQYSLGLIQFDNWTIIEDALVSQKKAFLNAQANALLTQADWIQAKGETLENAE